MKKVSENNTNRILNIWKQLWKPQIILVLSSTEAHLGPITFILGTCSNDFNKSVIRNFFRYNKKSTFISNNESNPL